jgi:hypothetical protein
MSSRDSRISGGRPDTVVQANQPDSIYINGKFITADSAFRVASAVAVHGGRFLAVGSTDEIRALAGPATAVIDFQGQTVLPGLIDTHVHVERAGLLKYTVRLNDVTSVEQALARISEYAAKLPKGRWIRGAQWHPLSQLAEKRFLTREELDSAAPNNPVCLPIGHFTLVNSEFQRRRRIPRAASFTATRSPESRTARWRRRPKIWCMIYCLSGPTASATSK